MVTIDTCGFEVIEEESLRCWCWVRISDGAGLKLIAWPTCSQDCHLEARPACQRNIAVPEPLVLKDDKNTMEVVEMAQKMLAR
jgi:hypothetical protein